RQHGRSGPARRRHVHRWHAGQRRGFKFSIERAVAGASGTLTVEMRLIDEITAVDEHTVRIHTSQPVAGVIYDRLPYGDFLLVSPTAVNNGVDLLTNPVGAGPSMLDSLTPNQSL